MIRKVAAVIGVLVLGLVLLAVSCSSGAKPAATPADFYKGKTIDFTVTVNPGSEQDVSARFLAQYLSQDAGSYVTVTNRRGASGLEGLIYIYRAKADGLSIGNSASTTIVMAKVMGDPAADYDVGKFSYIFGISKEPSFLFVSPDGPFQSVAALLAGKNLKLGAGSATANMAMAAVSICKVLALDAKVVTGLKDEAARSMAVKRGEIVGYSTNMPTAQAGVAAGLTKPLFVFATERHPGFPDIPAITESLPLSGENLDLVKLWGGPLASTNYVFGPPGMPQDRLAFLRGLSDKWAKDEVFRAAMDRINGVATKTYLTGPEIEKVNAEVAALLEKYKTIFADMIAKYRA